MALIGNNPGNIRLIRKPDGSPPSPFIGEVRPNSGPFRKFGNLETGLRAMFMVVMDHINRGLNTPLLLLASYAPKGDGQNNPIKYAADVSKMVGIKPTDKIGSHKLVSVIEAMARIETGKPLPEGVARRVASMLKNDDYFKNLPGSSGSSSGAPYAPAPGSGGGVGFWSDPKKRDTAFAIGGVLLIGGIVYVAAKKKHSRH